MKFDDTAAFLLIQIVAWGAIVIMAIVALVLGTT